MQKLPQNNNALWLPFAAQPVCIVFVCSSSFYRETLLYKLSTFRKKQTLQLMFAANEQLLPAFCY